MINLTSALGLLLLPLVDCPHSTTRSHEARETTN
jgi:hypothetical protein